MTLFFQHRTRAGVQDRWWSAGRPEVVRHDTGGDQNWSLCKSLCCHGLGSPGVDLAEARRPLAFFDANSFGGSRARLFQNYGASLPTTVQQRKPGENPWRPREAWSAQSGRWWFIASGFRRGFALGLGAESNRGNQKQQRTTRHWPSKECGKLASGCPAPTTTSFDQCSVFRTRDSRDGTELRNFRQLLGGLSGQVVEWISAASCRIHFPPFLMDNTIQTQNAPASSASKRPLKTIREDDCSASIWPRTVTKDGSDRIFYSVTFERRYKDKDGQFHYTKSFDAGSLSQLATVIQKTSDELQALQASH